MDEQAVQSKNRNFLQLSVWTITLLISISLLSSDNFAASTSSVVVAILLLCLAIFGALWTRSIFARKGIDLSTPLDAGMMAVLVAVVISAIFSLDPSRSLRAAVNWFALVIVYYMAVSAFRSGWRISIFERALLFVLGLVMLTAYLELFFWIQNNYFVISAEALPSPKLIRVSGIINNPNSFALFLNVGIMIVLGLKISLQQRRWPVAILLWLILTAPLVVLHGSRNGWLSAIFGFACLLITWFLWRAGGHKIGRRTWLRIGLIILGTVLIGLLLVTFIRPTTFNIDQVSGYATRTTFWRIALATWRENPLTGQGPGTFTTAFLQSVNVPFEPLFASAHSLFFNMTTEMGILGMVAYLILFGQILLMVRDGYRHNRLTANSPGLVGALGALLAFSLIDYLWLQVQLVTFLLLAALVADLRPKPAMEQGRIVRKKVFAVALPIIWILVLIAGFMEYRTSRIYESGVTAAEASDWSVARENFELGGGILPYSESSFLFAEGFAEGVLAQYEAVNLPTAIAAYELAIELEPGWSLNYANLAGLHWQAGNPERAKELMQRAAKLSPAVLLYHLNLGLWYEESGQSAEALTAYQQLLAINAVAGEAQFWLATPIRTAAWQGREDGPQGNAQEELELAYAALDNAEPELALKHLSKVLEEQPNLPAAHHARGIAYFISDDLLAAEDAWQLTSSGPTRYRQYSQLWQSLLPDGQEEDALSLLTKLTRPSIFEPKNHELSTYNRGVFVRPGLPAEILPQLSCFAPPAELGRQLDWLWTWVIKGEDTELGLHLTALIDTDKDGLLPCMVTPQPIPEQALVNQINLQKGQ